MDIESKKRGDSGYARLSFTDPHEAMIFGHTHFTSLSRRHLVWAIQMHRLAKGKRDFVETYVAYDELDAIRSRLLDVTEDSVPTMYATGSHETAEAARARTAHTAHTLAQTLRSYIRDIVSPSDQGVATR